MSMLPGDLADAGPDGRRRFTRAVVEQGQFVARLSDMAVPVVSILAKLGSPESLHRIPMQVVRTTMLNQSDGVVQHEGYDATEIVASIIRLMD